MGTINDNGTIRRAFAISTYKDDLRMNERFAELAKATVTDLKGTVQQFIVSIQPFGHFIMEHSTATRVAWENDEDDEKVDRSMKAFLELAADNAKAHGVFDEHVFLNYAAPWQSPVASCGQNKVKAMKAASEKYDPDQIFQRAVPGGFKLPANIS